MIHYVGFTGKMGTGKTTCAKILKDMFPNSSEIFSFGNALKLMLQNAGICTHEELYYQKTEFSRMMMQKIGTELIRKQIDPLFWIKKIQENISKTKANVAIIDDVRFLNEATWLINKSGLLIKLERDDNLTPFAGKHSETFSKHQSESEMDSIKAAHTIVNDGTIKELSDKLEQILESEWRWKNPW